MRRSTIAMGLKLAQFVLRTRGATTAARGAGGLASGIGTAVMVVAALQLASQILSSRR
ncbi:hypothetical protein KY389_05530 [Paracoccus bogoriensis]|uniref:hypothetical protein n=1 Tax=Paracoccus bogoriensis TaxID=242065 RepID=UPI001CA4D2F2|nr:hypothetical protein [Paracoccus bogoriensis]MBW7056159.1 hypothetical protein [Paracoccus bogoriensis]